MHNLSDPRMDKLLGHKISMEKPRYNVRPFQKLPVIIYDEDVVKHVVALWGIKIPIRGKETSIINAKSENLGSPFWKRMKPALIPCNGFFEWSKVEGNNVPYYFIDKDKDMFFMAGLYLNKEFVVLTTSATGVVKKVHHRMPVIFKPGTERSWLDGELPKHYDNLKGAEVSDKVNNSRNEGAELIYPIKTL